jgi:hypothetical protein
MKPSVYSATFPRKKEFTRLLVTDAAFRNTLNNRRGMAEQWIKEGKNAVKWTIRQQKRSVLASSSMGWLGTVNRLRAGRFPR